MLVRGCVRLGVLLCALVLSARPALGGEGFGVFNKDFAALDRVNPPKVFIPGARIAVRTGEAATDQRRLTDRIKTALESELLGADPRLSLDEASPETVIDLAVLQNRFEEQWETRNVIRQRQRGKDSKGKPIWESYETTARFKVVAHNYSAAFKVTDTRTHATLDADTYTIHYKDGFEDGNGAPEEASREVVAVNGTATFVQRRLTPSKERIGVLLPRGSLKELARLGEAGLWNQYLEALQARPPLRSPVDDSYRLYGIGLCYEALGYVGETTDDTLRYLQQASAFYNQALQANPGEKYFSSPYRRGINLGAFFTRPTSADPDTDVYPAPLERVRTALVDYQRIKEFAELSATSALAQSAKSAGPGDVERAPAEDVLDNSGVIEMFKAGVSEGVIRTAIEQSGQLKCDVTPKGLIQLTKAGVSKGIIELIQKRAGGA